MKNIDADYLILVNRDHMFNCSNFKNFKYVETESTDSRTILIEEKTNEQFNKLKEKMKLLGITIGIKHALRNESEQQKLYKNFCVKYGKDYADKIVCPIGTSEHHTGLAVDVEVNINGEWVSNNEQLMITEPILKKIHPYLFEYGFILRYPENKQEITKLPYEPWHIRYVGNEMAKYLYKNGLVLEEVK